MKQNDHEIIAGQVVHNVDPGVNDIPPGLDEIGESCVGDAHYFQHAADGKISCYYCGLSHHVEQDDSDEA